MSRFFSFGSKTGTNFRWVFLFPGLLPCFLYAQTKEISYGLQLNLNGSVLTAPANDSFNSAVSWGASLFIDYPLTKRFGLQVLPGFNILSYSKETEAISFKSTNIELALDAVWEPPSTKKTWLTGGLVPSYQLNKQRTELKGSSTSGTAKFMVDENYAFDLGLKAGLGFGLVPGVRLNLSYSYFMLKNYNKTEIIGRPSHWQLSAQIRLNELKLKRKPRNNAVVDSLQNGTLLVLLPVNDLIRKKIPFDHPDWVERDSFNVLLVKGFRDYYTFSKVVFCYDSSLKYLNVGLPVLLDPNLNPSPEQRLTGYYMIAGPMEYFVATNERSMKGLFLFDASMEIIRDPFTGYFKLNMDKFQEALQEEIYHAVMKLNATLQENKSNRP